MNDSDADTEVECMKWMRKIQGVRNDCSMRLVGLRNVCQRRGPVRRSAMLKHSAGVGKPVRSNDKDSGVHSQVFAISATYIKTYRARFALIEKALDNRPWFIPGGREVGCDLFVYLMNMLFLVFEFAHQRDSCTLSSQSLDPKRNKGKPDGVDTMFFLW